MTAIARILSALEEAPATADELALVADVPRQSMGTYLTELSRMGLIKRDGVVVREIIVNRRSPLWRSNREARKQSHG